MFFSFLVYSILMNDTLESLNIRLEKQIEEYKSFSSDPTNEDYQEGCACLKFEMLETKERILQEIKFLESEKQIATELIAKI